MIGGGEEIRRQGGEGKNRAPRKKRILSLSDLFLPRPVRPRSCHHELTIARYPIFASKPRAPFQRRFLKTIFYSKRAYARLYRHRVGVPLFLLSSGKGQILGVLCSHPWNVFTDGSRGEQLDESRLRARPWKLLGILSSFCNWEME